MPRYASAAWRAYRPGSRITVRAPAAITSERCRIMGLDPGSLRTGYAIIDCVAGREVHIASGCIRVSSASSGGMAARLRQIFDTLQALVAEHRPDEVAIERVFMHKNADSALKLGQARGAALCAASSGAGVVHEYAPRAIKLAVTGYGAADKQQVAQMVTMLLALSRKPGADEADALAIALCHAQSRRVLAAVAAR